MLHYRTPFYSAILISTALYTCVAPSADIIEVSTVSDKKLPKKKKTKQILSVRYNF